MGLSLLTYLICSGNRTMPSRSDYDTYSRWLPESAQKECQAPAARAPLAWIYDQRRASDQPGVENKGGCAGYARLSAIVLLPIWLRIRGRWESGRRKPTARGNQPVRPAWPRLRRNGEVERLHRRSMCPYYTAEPMLLQTGFRPLIRRLKLAKFLYSKRDLCYRINHKRSFVFYRQLPAS